MDGGDAAIALPGGPGTLAEIALLWNRMLVNAIAARPLILIGEGWRQVFMTFYESHSRYIPAVQRSCCSSPLTSPLQSNCSNNQQWIFLITDHLLSSPWSSYGRR
jgi:hypothetical protein